MTVTIATRPPAAASTDERSIIDRQVPPVMAASRYGTAFPSVSDATRMPSAAPRLVLNQPATIFMPGGYTRASAVPVAKRHATTSTGDGAEVTRALAAAAPKQPMPNTQRGFTRSDRLSSAATRVPATNPPCTAIVSQAAWAVVR